MNKIKPLESNEPIIVSKDWDKYNLIDGYHRLKFHKENNDSNLNVILLECDIKRKDDKLIEFMKRITGETICFLIDEIFKINNKIHYIECNEGCAGCRNGNSSFYLQPNIINKKINIKKVKAKNKDDDFYDLFINDIFIAKVDTGWGNGYYGGDFKIKI